MNHDTLFEGADFIVGTDDPDDPLLIFARKFGASTTTRLSTTDCGVEKTLRSIAPELITGMIDGIVVLTAGGAIRLLECGSFPDAERFHSAIADSRLIAAGPLAKLVMQRKNLQPTLTIRDVSDWRKILATLNTVTDLPQSHLIVESTIHDVPLRGGLESRGLTVSIIPLLATPRFSNNINMAQPTVAALAADAEGLAAILNSLKLSGLEERRILFFTASPTLAESAMLTGMETRLLQTARTAGQWHRDEAEEIASGLW